MGKVIYIAPAPSGGISQLNQGTGITLTPNPITGTGTVALTIPVVIASGGTNSTAPLSGSSIMVSNGTAIIQGAKGTATTVLHGNAAGLPAYSAVNLASDITGNLPVTNLNNGSGASNTTFWRGDGTWGTPIATVALNAEQIAYGSPTNTVTSDAHLTRQFDGTNYFGIGVSDNNENIFIGNVESFAGNGTVAGVGNIGIGEDALGALTTGGGNVAIGGGNLSTVETGGGLIAIGGGIDVSVDGLINSIALGTDAVITQSNQFVVGGNNSFAISSWVINNIEYSMPDANALGYLNNDGSGDLTWIDILPLILNDGDVLAQSVSGGVINFDSVGNPMLQELSGSQSIGFDSSNNNLRLLGLPAYGSDAAAGAGGLVTNDVYETDGTGLLPPFNVPGVLMLKQ